MAASLDETMLDDYRTSLDGATCFLEYPLGPLLLSGRGRQDLLHRLTTNDINALQPGQTCRSVWLTPQGRIVDVLNVSILEDTVWVTSSSGDPQTLHARLEANIFFSDEVSIEDRSTEWKGIRLCGSGWERLLERGEFVSTDSLSPSRHRFARFGAVQTLLVRDELGERCRFLWWVPAEEMEAIRRKLAARKIPFIQASTYEILRVEQGIGAFGKEWSESFLPLEANLMDAISFDKGCYVGQEVIARMHSRQRLARQLRGLKLREPVVPGPLIGEGEDAGTLTSCVVSPRFGPIGLGYVRRRFSEPGSRLCTGEGAIEATVCELPFG